MEAMSVYEITIFVPQAVDIVKVVLDSGPFEDVNVVLDRLVVPASVDSI